MQVVAILQARMTSTRLPGKVLKPILNTPLLEWMFRQLNACHRIDRFVLATTVNATDDPVVQWAEEHGVEVFRGSEADVLDRYYKAALQAGGHDGDVVVRLTCDCPLIQPELCDRCVEEFLAGGFDYLYTGPLYAEGLDCEVFSFDVLRQSWEETSLPSDREHVTLFVRNMPDRYTLHYMEHDRDDGKYRITVDEPEDFEVIRRIIEALYDPERPYIGFEAIRNWLEAHPEVMALNSHVVRNAGTLKSLAEDGRV